MGHRKTSAPSVHTRQTSQSNGRMWSARMSGRIFTRCRIIVSDQCRSAYRSKVRRVVRIQFHISAMGTNPGRHGCFLTPFENKRVGFAKRGHCQLSIRMILTAIKDLGIGNDIVTVTFGTFTGLFHDQNGTSSSPHGSPATFHSSSKSAGQSSRKREGRWMTSPL
jgi:hypothetical protein